MLNKKIIKFLLSIILNILIKLDKKDRYRFLLHYITGNGSSLDIDKTTSKYSDLYYSLDLRSIAKLSSRNIFNIDMGSYYTNINALKYPEIFYCLGGFVYSLEYDGNSVKIKVSDTYDWDSKQGINSTAIHKLFVNNAIIKIINKIVGYEALMNSSKTTFINHKFFEYLGGTPFQTNIVWELSLYDWKLMSRL